MDAGEGAGWTNFRVHCLLTAMESVVRWEDSADGLNMQYMIEDVFNVFCRNNSPGSDAIRHKIQQWRDEWFAVNRIIHSGFGLDSITNRIVGLEFL